MMKPDKIFECSCADGFTGHFCQFKTEQDHLLFMSRDWNGINKPPLVFNGDGRLIEENAGIEKQAGAYGSCSTMMNGEAIIFGGLDSDIKRQVLFKSICISLKYHFRFRWFLNAH